MAATETNCCHDAGGVPTDKMDDHRRWWGSRGLLRLQAEREMLKQALALLASLGPHGDQIRSDQIAAPGDKETRRRGMVDGSRVAQQSLGRKEHATEQCIPLSLLASS